MKLPVVFVPLPLVLRGNVRVVLIRDPVQMSASIFGPSKSLLRFSVRILLSKSLTNRAPKKLFLISPSLGDTRAALHFSHSEHHVTISFFTTKYGMVQVKFLFGQSSCVFLGYQTSRTSAVDDAFCPIFSTVGTLGNGRHFAHIEAFQVHIENYLL